MAMYWSLASDLGVGQPMEFALGSCVLAVRLGEALGFSESELRAAYYQALLRFTGCSADAYIVASVVGDELPFRAEAAPRYNGHMSEMLWLHDGQGCSTMSGAWACP